MGKQWKQWLTLFFWAPKSLQMVIAAMKLKDAYSLEKKVITNLDSMLKSRDITLSTKAHLIKAMVFPVVMYGCESWTVRKAECQRIDAFELWCWRRLLRVPWAARRSDQSILKEISPGCSLEGLMLKLKLQYFGHLLWRVDSLEKTLMLGGIGAGKEGDNRGWDGWMASLTQWTWVRVNFRSWWWTREAWPVAVHGVQRVGHDSNWTELPGKPLQKGSPSHIDQRHPIVSELHLFISMLWDLVSFATISSVSSVQFISVAQSCPTLCNSSSVVPFSSCP